MNAILALLAGAVSLLVVALGFGAIIFIHELGHFLAAKWARIRVLAFAVGFGPAVVSYRKGMGLRRGSSEPDYLALTQKHNRPPPGVSPTEYRLNALPLGGYVKMLGQEDLNPEAVSAENDSYQAAPVWKRMVVISAGVIMNLLSAGALFIAVFMIGLQTEPPTVGTVAPGSPAAIAIAENAERAGVERPGLEPGDRVLRIAGREPMSFNDIVLAAAMGERGAPIEVIVARTGVPEPLTFRVVPDRGQMTGLLELGVGLPSSSAVVDPGPRNEAIFREALSRAGLPGVEPGMRLVRVAGRESDRPSAELSRAFAESGGEPVELVFAHDDGRRVTVRPEPIAEQMAVLVPTAPRTVATVEHLLGLVGVMGVASAEPDQPGERSPSARGYAQGLRTGDVFVRLGETVYPSVPEGMRAIREHAGRAIPATVRRQGELVELTLNVRRDGTVGFSVASTADHNAAEPETTGIELALPPRTRADREARAEPWSPPAASLIQHAGTRLLAIEGRPVRSISDVRAALARATRDAFDAREPSASVRVTLAMPLASAGETIERDWTLDAEALGALHALSWRAPFSTMVFEPERMLLRADGPIEAVAMGVRETHRVMMSTYLTLVRLFQGTVRVEHLRGPVGIAHMGTQILDRGVIWLLFFFGLISVNLAVINFLPIPIVDGGQFLMLMYEGLRGKPVPIPLQNALTLAGLVLIGSVFVVVTFYDVRNLFGL